MKRTFIWLWVKFGYNFSFISIVPENHFGNLLKTFPCQELNKNRSGSLWLLAGKFILQKSTVLFCVQKNREHRTVRHGCTWKCENWWCFICICRIQKMTKDRRDDRMKCKRLLCFGMAAAQAKWETSETVESGQAAPEATALEYPNRKRSPLRQTISPKPTTRSHFPLVAQHFPVRPPIPKLRYCYVKGMRCISDYHNGGGN